MSIRTSYDKNVDVLYINNSDNIVHRRSTDERFSDIFLIGSTITGKIVSLTICEFSTGCWNKKDLLEVFVKENPEAKELVDTATSFLKTLNGEIQ